MILPNKLISFQDCILAKTVYILEKISDSDFSVIGLYEQVETHFGSGRSICSWQNKI